MNGGRSKTPEMRAALMWLVAAAASLGTMPLGSATVCMDRVCAVDEYCTDNVECSSCVGICNPDGNNYDMVTCHKACTGYLQVLHIEKYLDEVYTPKVYKYVAVSLTISALVLVLVLAAFFLVWLKYQRRRCYKNQSLKKKMDSIKVVCVNEVDGGGKKLKLDMPVVRPETDKNREQSPPSALTAMTPLSTRHPSEDATLEYAYDNPTLTHSPQFGKNQPHSTPNTTPLTTRTETTF